MVPLSRSGTVRRGNHLQCQKLRKHLGIQLVTLTSRLGDHSQLLRMSEQHLLGQRFDEPPEPFLTGRRFDDSPTLSPVFKERMDAAVVPARQTFALQHRSLLIANTKTDRLFVEVDADEFHGDTFLLWKHEQIKFPTPQRTPLGSTSSWFHPANWQVAIHTDLLTCYLHRRTI